ncbi:MAG: hypothetical protein JXA42_13415 [Anaerolineales bacterium]|nr:hypothetical protein [Anaerolineales bacterium]
MFDLIIIIVFEFLLALLVAGTLYEWWVSKRHRALFPILAFGFSMLAFITPPDAASMHPWTVGFIWLLIGVILRVLVRQVRVLETT